jgi:TRAP-type C4-dicarboxylate transport system permease large subunit
MFLIAAAMVSAWLITVAQIPTQMVKLLEPFMGNQTLLLIAIMVLCMLGRHRDGHDADHPDPDAGA